MKKYKYIYSLLFLLITGCIGTKNKNVDINIIGSWQYVDNDSNYTEVYIDSSKMISFSEKTLFMGPYMYTIKNNQISFNGLRYKILPTDFKSMIWSNSEYTLKMSRIDSFVFDFKDIKDDVNPFYLRKYVYLVNHGNLTTREALELLCGKRVGDNNEYIEEELNVNHR